VPINSQSGFWEFTSTQIAIGNSQPLTVTGGSGIAIADTGTSLLIVDPPVVSAYWSQVSGALNSAQSGGVVFPCDSALPDLGLAIGDTYMANISGSLMNFAQAGTDSQTGQACKFTFSPFYLASATAPRRGETILFVIGSTDMMGKKTVCFGALQSNGGANLQIYGDIFFKSQFVAFDGVGPSIGVAPHV
jgi:hypothetical protein